jgi:hypothetical protein
MLNAFVVIAIVILFILFFPSAYAIWYAKTGRYELDKRLDTATKR